MTAFRLLLRTAMPLVWGQLALAANTFVTQFFLARHATVSLHASLPGSMLAVAWMSFFNATLGYAGTLIAQRHGAGRTDEAHRIFILSVALALVTAPLLLLGIPLAHFILGSFHTPPEVLTAEIRYFEYLLPNGALTILATVLGGFFTGQGRTRLVGGSTVLGFLVNMAIAPFFIDGLWFIPAGIIGAALAQAVGHLVPCVILAAAIPWRSDVPSLQNEARPSADSTLHLIFDILKFGLPNGVRTLLEIGGFFLFTAFIAECDAVSVASSTVLFALNGIFYNCVQGLASAVEILVARRAAEQLRRTAVLTALAFALISILLITGIILTFAPAFMPHAATFSAASFTAALTALLPIQVGKTGLEFVNLVLQGDLRGRGETAFVCRVQALVTFLVWIPSYVCVRSLHPTVPAYWSTMLISGVAFLILVSREVCAKAEHGTIKRHCRKVGDGQVGDRPTLRQYKKTRRTLKSFG